MPFIAYMSETTFPKISSLHRFLMIFVPDSAATLTGGGIVLIAFALGILEMLCRQYAAAENSFYMAFGMLAFLITMKYMALRANMLVAKSSNSILRTHIRQLNAVMNNPRASQSDKQEKLEEAARERAQMLETMGALKEAIQHIQPEAPIRPKYEATIEMMERALLKS